MDHFRRDVWDVVLIELFSVYLGLDALALAVLASSRGAVHARHGSP